jgi:hypothetical protein
MPWNPFKSKKGDKADKAQPLKTGFHPIDLNALSTEKAASPTKPGGSGGSGGGPADAARGDPSAVGPLRAAAEREKLSNADAEDDQPLLAAYPGKNF